MQRTYKFFSGLISGGIGLLMIPIFLLFPLGGLYWLWMSIQLGSFAMFALGLIPPFVILTSVMGAWSLIFGLPKWVFNIFF
jgi:hypothetical protein